MDPRPRRVRVTHPRTAAARSGRSRSVGGDVAEQTDLGRVLVRSLARAQLRLALLVAACVGGVLAGLPLLFLLLPAAAQAEVAGFPVAWLLLAVLVFPLIVLGAWAYIAGAERNERRFIDLVDRP